MIRPINSVSDVFETKVPFFMALRKLAYYDMVSSEEVELLIKEINKFTFSLLSNYTVCKTNTK